LLRKGRTKAAREELAKTGKIHGPLRKHLFPEPRLSLGQWLAAQKLATSMMDLSDGLSTDLPRLCAASRVGAFINSTHVPFSPLKREGKLRSNSTAGRRRALQLALDGGDDYELLFTADPRRACRIPSSFRGLPLTRIGEITRDRRLILKSESGNVALQSRGWDPFRK